MKTKFLVAPDSFKGCLPCDEVAEALAAGLSGEVTLCPLSDGGEGLLAAVGGEVVEAACSGPHGERLVAAYRRHGSRAVVELARASGLSVTARRDPVRARSTGTGELVAAARLAGASEVWVGAGGSATVDGGVGALRALGYRFLDGSGRDAVALHEVASVVRGAPLDDVTVLYDVENGWLGPEGAAAVYGPQKGASDVDALEAGLARVGAVLAESLGRDPRRVTGGGAAGGLAGGLWAAGAELRRGFDAVAEQVGLDAAVAEADVVVTGEGRVDGQTRYGKTVAGVVKRAGGRPTWVFGGEVTPEAEAWAPENVALIPVADGPRSLASSVERAPELLRRAAARASRLWCLALLGCGGAPPVAVEASAVPQGPLELVVEHVVGSGYRDGCVSEAGVFALRAFRLERWDLSAGAPPRLRASVKVGQLGETAMASQVGCAGDRALVVLGDDAVGVQGDAVVWRGRRAAAEGWPAVTEKRKPPPGARWIDRLADGRFVLLGDWGRGTKAGDAYAEWRAAAGGMRDAIFDGQVVWAVGASGLWRWRPGPGEPMSVPLPPEIAGKPLVGLFRDGPLLWLRDENDIGWPVDATGTVAKLAGKPGELPPVSVGQRVPVGGGFLELTAEGKLRPDPVSADQAWAWGHGPRNTVRRIVRLDAERVVVAGLVLRVLAIDDAMRPTVVADVNLRGETLGVFDVGDRLVLVGPDYGFAVLQMRPAKAAE